jgi:hypothetical protein
MLGFRLPDDPDLPTYLKMRLSNGARSRLRYTSGQTKSST